MVFEVSWDGGAEKGEALKQAGKSDLADLVRIREIRYKQKQNKQTNKQKMQQSSYFASQPACEYYKQ